MSFSSSKNISGNDHNIAINQDDFQNQFYQNALPDKEYTESNIPRPSSTSPDEKEETPSCRSCKPSVYYIYIVFSLAILTMSLTITLIPQLLVKLCDENVSLAAQYSGYLTSCSAFATFITSPFLGVMSDRYGRKPIVLLSLMGSAVDYAGLAYINDIWYLFITRTIGGMTNAILVVCFAYVADISTEKNRTRDFALLGSALGLSFASGSSILAGWMADEISFQFPFMIGVGITGFNILFSVFILPESKHKEAFPFKWSRLNPFRSVGLLLLNTLTLWLTVLYFFLCFSEDGTFFFK